MLETSLLASDSGLLFVGDEAERLYGEKHYIEPAFDFRQPPVVHGVLGAEGDWFRSSNLIPRRCDKGGPVILSLAGRSWQVGHIDWDRQTAQVTPADDRGKSRWLGESRPLSNRLCQASAAFSSIQRCARGGRTRKEQIASTRAECAGGGPRCNSGRDRPDRARVTWWTFAGLNANFELAASWPGTVRFDNFSVVLEGNLAVDSIQKWIRDRSPIDPNHFDRLPRPKFSDSRLRVDGNRPRPKYGVCTP
jgi:ATP-dependent Lhr-like helicase